MNNESIEIIRDTLKPDRELMEKAKKYAMTEKKSGIHIPALIAACLIVVICTLFAVTKTHNGDFVSTVPTSEATEEKELFYSDLVPQQSLTENQIRGNVLLSVAPFSEFYIKDCIAIIEGEILSVRTKDYTVIYEFDKFEKGGRLTSETETLIIEIRADKIWYGDIKEGLEKVDYIAIYRYLKIDEEIINNDVSFENIIRLFKEELEYIKTINLNDLVMKIECKES